MYVCVSILFITTIDLPITIKHIIAPIDTIFFYLYVSFVSLFNLTSFFLQITLTNTTGYGLLDLYIKFRLNG